MVEISKKELAALRRKAATYDQISANNSKAGKKSSANLTAEERRERARKAAMARWGKK